MPDTVPAMLEPGEFVIRKDAAEKIGDRNLNILNNYDRLENGNTAIDKLIYPNGNTDVDELIALSALNGAVNMSQGGDVIKQPQAGYFQDGGKIKDMRDRKGGYSIGVDDPLGEAYSVLDDVTMILKTAGESSPYNFMSSGQRDALNTLEDAGIYDTVKALKILKTLMKHRDEGTGYSTFTPRTPEDNIRILKNQPIKNMQEGGWGGSAYDIQRDAEEIAGFRMAMDDDIAAITDYTATAPDIAGFLTAQDTMRTEGAQRLGDIAAGVDTSFGGTGLNVGTVAKSAEDARRETEEKYKESSIANLTKTFDDARAKVAQQMLDMQQMGAPTAESLFRIENHPEHGEILKISNYESTTNSYAPDGNIVANTPLFDHGRRAGKDTMMVNGVIYKYENINGIEMYRRQY